MQIYKFTNNIQQTHEIFAVKMNWTPYKFRVCVTALAFWTLTFMTLFLIFWTDDEQTDVMISSDDRKQEQDIKQNVTDSDETYCRQILDYYQSDREDISFNGKYNFFSELKQDWFLYETMFRHMKGKGTYIDLAANNHRLGSNTYFLDTCLNWRGICIEAQEKYWENLEKERTCRLEKVCIYSERKMMNFGNTGNGWGGIKNSPI